MCSIDTVCDTKLIVIVVRCSRLGRKIGFVVGIQIR